MGHKIKSPMKCSVIKVNDFLAANYELQMKLNEIFHSEMVQNDITTEPLNEIKYSCHITVSWLLCHFTLKREFSYSCF